MQKTSTQKAGLSWQSKIIVLEMQSGEREPDTPFLISGCRPWTWPAAIPTLSTDCQCSSVEMKDIL